MAAKNKVDTAKKDTVSVRYVKKANMWCKTVVTGGKQSQEFSETRPQ